MGVNGTTLPQHLYDKVVAQASADPGLPASNPTTSYWQLPPHRTLFSVQSKALPSTTDYAIIGPGITGLSIAKHLLEHDEASTSCITVFEARTLCSGASGRNGGGLATFVPYAWPQMCSQYGAEKAIELAKFMYKTLEKMHALGNSNPEVKKRSEIRRTRDVTGFRDRETFEEMRDSFLSLQEAVPEAQLQVEVYDEQEARKNFGIITQGGMIRFNCGAFWPYRFITTWWELLHREHSDRLSIETNTPVAGVTYEAASKLYILETPRGTVRARHIFHATNGYTGHLLPNLRGAIMPIRGFMSAQHTASKFGNYGRDRTWSFFGAKGPLDEKTGIQESGVYYGNQSPEEDTIFWGNDLVPVDEWITADDSVIPSVTYDDLSTVLSKQFTTFADEKPRVKEMWSGTLGYTADHLPLVGKLSRTETGRDGDGEIICAGFNGAGMCQCWSSGEAAVKIALGESTEGVVPDLFLVTKERMDGKEMNAEAAVHAMFSGDWNH